MLEQLVRKLAEEFELGGQSLASEVPGAYALPLDEGLTIMMSEIPPGFLLKCSIAPCPKTGEEIFLTQAMLANLFGQGTRGATLGLTMDGNTLTLTLPVDYTVDYKEFRDTVEDFINAVDFWRDEVTSHKG